MTDASGRPSRQLGYMRRSTPAPPELVRPQISPAPPEGMRPLLAPPARNYQSGRWTAGGTARCCLFLRHPHVTAKQTAGRGRQATKPVPRWPLAAPAANRGQHEVLRAGRSGVGLGYVRRPQTAQTTAPPCPQTVGARSHRIPAPGACAVRAESGGLGYTPSAPVAPEPAHRSVACWTSQRRVMLVGRPST
jgi:hypothetical protein